MLASVENNSPSALPEQNAALVGFRAEAKAAMVGLARALCDVISALPGERKRPVDVERALRIDASLAWQMVQIADAPDPLAASVHVPGPGAMGRVFGAATACGVNAATIEAARRAYGEFESVVARHCDDRPSFDTMVSGLHGESRRKVVLRHKRAAYRANMHLWGVHAAAVINCVVYTPNTEGFLDAAHIRVYKDVKRLRPNIPYPLKLTAWRSMDRGDGTWALAPIQERKPIEPGAECAPGVSLLPTFCSASMPEIRIRCGQSGVCRADIVGRSIGQESASTCAVGDVLRNCVPWPSPGDDRLGSRLWIETPAEAALCDVLVPAGRSDPLRPTVSVYRHVSGSEGLVCSRDTDSLAVTEEAYYAGVGPAALRAAEYPRYPELIEFVCERLGWDAGAYDVYRCRVKFPVLNSGIEVNAQMIAPPSELRP